MFEDYLSMDEDNFALAYVESGGNPKTAYLAVFGEDAALPRAQGLALLAKPRVLARIRDLQSALQQSDLISLESHLVELANIRDQAKTMGILKVALEAEKSRGTVAGLYAGKGETAPSFEGTKHLEKLAGRLMGMMPKSAPVTDVVDVPFKESQDGD